MAYWRVIIKGSIGTVENWSTGVAFGIVGLAPDVPDPAAADGVLTEVLAATTAANVGVALRTLMSTSTNILSVRVELRAEDESILSLAEGLVTLPVSGSAPATKTPQDALVFSLRTATPGAKGRGRMYWPAQAGVLGSNFQLTDPTPADVATGAKTWLQAINSAIDDYYIGISSALRVALSVRSVTDHVCRDVTQIQVGSILDTQRRRRDILPESYSTVTYP